MTTLCQKWGCWCIMIISDTYYQSCYRCWPIPFINIHTNINPYFADTCISAMSVKTCNRHYLTHWGKVMYICASKLTMIGSDNGLLPGRCQTNIWTNAGMLLLGPFATNFSEILIEIYTFSFTKMHYKMLSGKWRPSCLGLNVLKHWQ